jgi:hypothetical protein
MPAVIPWALLHCWLRVRLPDRLLELNLQTI